MNENQSWKVALAIMITALIGVVIFVGMSVVNSINANTAAIEGLSISVVSPMETTKSEQLDPRLTERLVLALEKQAEETGKQTEILREMQICVCNSLGTCKKTEEVQPSLRSKYVPQNPQPVATPESETEKEQENTPVPTAVNTPVPTQTQATPSATQTQTTPTATKQPTIEPSKTVEPTKTTVTPPPTVEPSKTAEPSKTVQPTVEPSKTAQPTVEPSKTIVPTIEPTKKPKPTEVTTIQPTPKPDKTKKPPCNQGGAPEACDPGSSDHGNRSNDEYNGDHIRRPDSTSQQQDNKTLVGSDNVEKGKGQVEKQKEQQQEVNPLPQNNASSDPVIADPVNSVKKENNGKKK